MPWRLAWKPRESRHSKDSGTGRSPPGKRVPPRSATRHCPRGLPQRRAKQQTRSSNSRAICPTIVADAFSALPQRASCNCTLRRTRRARAVPFSRPLSATPCALLTVHVFVHKSKRRGQHHALCAQEVGLGREIAGALVRMRPRTEDSAFRPVPKPMPICCTPGGGPLKRGRLGTSWWTRLPPSLLRISGHAHRDGPARDSPQIL